MRKEIPPDGSVMIEVWRHVFFEAEVGEGPDKYKWSIFDGVGNNVHEKEDNIPVERKVELEFAFPYPEIFKIVLRVYYSADDRGVGKEFMIPIVEKLKADILKPEADEPDPRGIFNEGDDIPVKGGGEGGDDTEPYRFYWKVDGDDKGNAEGWTLSGGSLAAGKHKIRLTVKDKSDNKAEDLREILIIKGLSVEIVKPAGDYPDKKAVFKKGSRADIIAKAEGGLEPYTWEWKITGPKEASSTAEESIDLNEFDLPLGKYTVKVTVKDKVGKEDSDERIVVIIPGKLLDKYSPERNIVLAGNAAHLIGMAFSIDEERKNVTASKLRGHHDWANHRKEEIEEMDGPTQDWIKQVRINEDYFEDKRFDIPKGKYWQGKPYPLTKQNIYAIDKLLFRNRKTTDSYTRRGMNIIEVIEAMDRIYQNLKEEGKIMKYKKTNREGEVILKELIVWSRYAEVVNRVALLAREKGHPVGEYDETTNPVTWKGFNEIEQGAKMDRWVGAQISNYRVREPNKQIERAEGELEEDEQTILKLFRIYTIRWHWFWNVFELGVWQMNRLIDVINKGAIPIVPHDEEPLGEGGGASGVSGASGALPENGEGEDTETQRVIENMGGGATNAGTAESEEGMSSDAKVKVLPGAEKKEEKPADNLDDLLKQLRDGTI